MSEAQSEITAYLDRYAATLTNFDAQGAAELWSTPGVIVDDTFTGVLESREAMIQGLEQSYPIYRRLGLASVDYELLGRQQLSEGMEMLQVRWLFYDAEGKELTDGNSYYLVRRDDGRLRACVCIQTDDL
jgi:hypothetical protein